MDIEQDRVLKIEEVGKLLRLSSSKVYYLVARGEIPHLKIGRNVRIRKSDLERWLETQQVGDQQQPLAGFWSPQKPKPEAGQFPRGRGR